VEQCRDFFSLSCGFPPKRYLARAEPRKKHIILDNIVLVGSVYVDFVDVGKVYFGVKE
jgi:hypothetical protein